MSRSVALAILMTLGAGCSDGGAGPVAPLKGGPTNLAAGFRDDGSLVLTWSLENGPFDGLVLEWRAGDAPWTPVGNPNPSWQGVALTIGPAVPEAALLWFRLGGERRGQLTVWSEETNIKNRARAATAFAVVEGADLELTWVNASLVSTTPELWRQIGDLDGYGEPVQLPLPEGATSYRDARPAPGNQHLYRLRYLHQGTPGWPAYAASATRPITVAAPELQVVEGVGFRVTLPALPAGVLRLVVTDEGSPVTLQLGAGPLEVARWPLSPLTSAAVTGTALGAQSGRMAPVESGRGRVPPFTLPGPRPLLAAAAILPGTGEPVRGPDGRFHGAAGGTLWVGYPDAPDSLPLERAATDLCPLPPAVDRAGLVHLVYERPGATTGEPSVLAYAQHGPTGWQTRDLTTFVATGHCPARARVAGDGQVHVLLVDAATQGSRYLVGTGGAITVERTLPGLPAALALAPDGTAYALTTRGLASRDPLGVWTDLAAPLELLDPATVLVAADGGRLAAARAAPVGTGSSVVWREWAAGAWGAEETVVASRVAAPGPLFAVLGEDGDLAVLGGQDLTTPAGRAGSVILERRGGTWRPVDVAGLRAVRALGLHQGRLWVVGQREAAADGDPFSAPAPTALYQDP